MEVYILDSLLRRTEVFDKFESMVWTERWQDVGDFQLDLVSTLENRTQFLPGIRLAINNSHRVMTVETVEDATDSEGKDILRVNGRSLESLLEDRAAIESFTGITSEAKWILIDPPATIARTMFDHICRAPAALDAADVIPFLTEGPSFFPEDTLPEINTPIVWEQDPASLYEAISGITQLYDLGFRLVRNFDTSQLYFDIYSGHDRTTRQAILPPVVFSPNLDNLQNTTELNTIEKSKNVAYVYSDAGSLIVLGDNVDPDVEGFDRRIIVVSATVEAEDPDPVSRMTQAGNEALLQNRAVSLFDGEVNEYGEYIYGVHYELGDLVELRNRDGVVTYKRVSEQIFVSDSNGDRSYPTLSVDLFTGVNDWLSWTNKTTVWEDFTTETWEDM